VYAGIFEDLQYGVLIDDKWNVHLFNYDASEENIERRSFRHTNKNNVVTQLTGGPFKVDGQTSTPRYDIDQEVGQITLLYDEEEKSLKNIFKIF